MSSGEGELPRNQQQDLRDLLRQRDFMLLLAGQFLSQLGDQFTLISAFTLVTDLSPSPLAMVIPAVSMALPQILFSLLGGVIADRWNRKLVMVSSDLMRALLVLGVILSYLTGHLWILYIAAAALALVASFFYPARNATIPNIVPSGLILTANGLIQVSYITALTLGPALAGATVQLWGLIPAIIFDSSTYLISATAILIIRIPPPSSNGPAELEGGSVWQDMKEGLAYIRGNRILRRVLYITAVTTLGLGAVVVLGIPHLRARMAAGGLAYGLAMSMLGIGSVFGGLVVTRLSRSFATNRIVGAMLIAGGCAILSFAFASSYLVVLLAVVVLGMCLVVARGSLDTITQKLPPDEMCGRVQSVVNLVVQAGIALAEGLAALLGHLTGVQAAFVGAGAAMAAAGLGAAFSLREAARIVTPRARRRNR
jgi:MFS family permease